MAKRAEVPEFCICGRGPFTLEEWCPVCWPDKQPKAEQLSFGLVIKETNNGK